MKKKLLVFILIVMGIGTYWLSQNMWVFEEQIDIEDYEAFLVDTKWIEKEERYWFFEKKNLSIYTRNNKDSINYDGDWLIDNKTVIEFNLDSTPIEYNTSIIWNIIHISNKHLILQVELPVISSGTIRKLKRA